MNRSVKEVINSNQLFTMIILFELGTSLVVHIGHRHDQGVWLAVLLAMPGAVLLYLVFDYLARQYPESILSGYTCKILGSHIGWVISLLYIPFFIHHAARILRESGDLLITVTYDRTPSLLIQGIMIMTVTYILYKGIEVFSRLGEIYFIILIVLGLLGNMMVLFSGIVDLGNLRPLLGDGWGSIIQSAYPYIFGFPFAELVCFTTVLPHLNQIQTGRNTGIAAILVSGTLLSLTHALDVSVLGADIYSRATFPLFTMITLVNIGEFLQRLDAIVILTLIIGVFFKITLFCYAATAVAADIFNISDRRKLAYPIGAVVLITSLLSSRSLPEHNEEGTLIPKLILSCFIPLLLFMVHHIRNRLKLTSSK